jgi:hypothetical protein
LNRFAQSFGAAFSGTGTLSESTSSAFVSSTSIKDEASATAGLSTSPSDGFLSATTALDDGRDDGFGTTGIMGIIAASLVGGFTAGGGMDSIVFAESGRVDEGVLGVVDEVSSVGGCVASAFAVSGVEGALA